MVHLSLRSDIDFHQSSNSDFYNCQIEAEELFKKSGDTDFFRENKFVGVYKGDNPIFVQNCKRIKEVAHTALDLPSENESLARVLSASAAMHVILPKVSISQEPPIPQAAHHRRDAQVLVGTAPKPSTSISDRENLQDRVSLALHDFRRNFVHDNICSDEGDRAFAVHRDAEAFYSKKLHIQKPDERPTGEVAQQLVILEKSATPPSKLFWQQWYTVDNLLTVVARALQEKMPLDNPAQERERFKKDLMWWKNLYHYAVARQNQAYFFRNEDEVLLKGQYTDLAKDSESDDAEWENKFYALERKTIENGWKSPLGPLSSFQKKFNEHAKSIETIIEHLITSQSYDKTSLENLEEKKKKIFSNLEKDADRFKILSELNTTLKSPILTKIVDELAKIQTETKRSCRQEYSRALCSVNWDSWVCNNTFQAFREATWDTNMNMPTRYGALILLLNCNLIKIPEELLFHNSPYESLLMECVNYSRDFILNSKDTAWIQYFIRVNPQYIEKMSDDSLLQEGMLTLLIDNAEKKCSVIPQRILEIETTLSSDILRKFLEKFKDFLSFDSLCKCCLKFETLEDDMLSLLPLQEIRDKKLDIFTHLGTLNPSIYSIVHGFSTDQMKALVKNRPELAQFLKYKNKRQEISITLHAGNIIKTVKLLTTLVINKIAGVIKNAFVYLGNALKKLPHKEIRTVLKILDIFLTFLGLIFDIIFMKKYFAALKSRENRDVPPQHNPQLLRPQTGIPTRNKMRTRVF